MLSFLISSILLVGVDAQVQGDVRLVNGSSPWDGTLQVWNAGEWRHVCDDQMGRTQSLVVCRQLGYLPPDPQPHMCCQPVDPPVFWLDNVRCIGTEQRISDCLHNGWGNHNCGPREGVRIRCVFADPCRNDSCGAGSVCERIDNTEYTCRSPVEPREPPTQRITLTGAFDTLDQEPITPLCSQRYSFYMQISIGQQLERINQQIGRTLCNDTTGFQMLLASTSVAVNPSPPSQALITNAFVLVGSMHTMFSVYYACAAEVSSFLQDHSNWEPPVLPTPPGCSPVTFFGERFNEDSRDWLC